jgi:hypothetical protein
MDSTTPRGVHVDSRRTLWGTVKSSSDSAKSAKYPKSQITYNIYDGRYNAIAPRSSVSPPIELFHSAFACFLDDIKRGCIVPDNIIRKTVKFMKATSGIFASETVR